MRLVCRAPVHNTTVATERPIAASYDTIWADARTEPSRGYLEPDDQPASITPYSEMDDLMSRNRIPHRGSASCRRGGGWAMATAPPMGTIENVRNAGTRAR